MANITFPTASTMSVDISLEWPSQSHFLSIYTGDRQIISRGVGLWTGQIVWALRGRTDGAADIRSIEAFLIQLDGAANTFDVPMPVDQSDRFTRGTDLRCTAVTRTGSTMRLTCNRQSGLLTGDFITIENRLFQLASDLAGGEMLVSPYRPIDVTVADDSGATIGAAVNWSSPTMRARRTDSGAVNNLKNVDWAGPWTLQIVGI